jgi:hypothetical protein
MDGFTSYRIDDKEFRKERVNKEPKILWGENCIKSYKTGGKFADCLRTYLMEYPCVDSHAYHSQEKPKPKMVGKRRYFSDFSDKNASSNIKNKRYPYNYPNNDTNQV